MDPSAPPPQKPASRPLMGIFWMLVTGACFVAVTATVKVVGDDVPPAQAAFLRYVLGLVFLIPMIPAMRRTVLSPRALRLFGIRGAAHTLGVILWFYAMTQIPIAEVTAMNYLNPVYVSVLAVFVLGERMALRRILAVLVALVGALIILRPGFRELDTGHVAMLFTALAFAVGYLIAKIMADEVPASVVVFMLSVTVTIGLAPFAWWVWVPVGWEQIGWLFLTAVFATAGHYAMTLAFSAAPLTVTQPVTFLQLVWATLLGLLVFGEPVDVFVILGGGLIIGAVTFIAWREAVLRRQTSKEPAA
ncbi:MAG: DMT family transporter [Pseudomonadota bacterium]